MQRRSTIAIAASIAALLLVGSGCETSDIQDVMEILGGSQGIGIADVGQHAFGQSTGDKDKDDLLDTADTMTNVKKAGEFEDEAKEALGKKPTDYKTAREKLEAALKLRPYDWALREQLNVVLAEQGGSPDIKPPTMPTQLCRIHDTSKPSAKERRCFRAVMRDRGDAVEASIARQKAAGKLVSCATYRELQGVYDQFDRFTPSDMIMTYHYTDAEYDRLSGRSDHARAMVAHPGQSCDDKPAGPPV
ncbi:MAG TPA: hypothetical protein VL500_06025 [Candidatus Eisenbacteria bacterium]|jgi:hypothetical protein|nr:hypothetical protein [Candidatus Eisenbacteria bacterium]